MLAESYTYNAVYTLALALPVSGQYRVVIKKGRLRPF